MNQRFAGKVAMVTGGSAGIGFATARAFARDGARVVIAARRADEGEAAAEAIRAEGGDTLFVATDVTDAASVEALVARTLNTCGALHFAYNNAGISGTLNANVEDAAVDMFLQVMAVNVTGAWLSMKYQVPAILASGGGAIVNCGSAAGLRGSPGASAYHTSKHAVLGMTKSVAMENATRGIRVNAVCPGLVMTDLIEKGFADPEDLAHFTSLIPAQRAGKPDEIANAVLWLCSPEASYVTGAILSVDGGIAV